MTEQIRNSHMTNFMPYLEISSNSSSEYLPDMMGDYLKHPGDMTAGDYMQEDLTCSQDCIDMGRFDFEDARGTAALPIVFQSTAYSSITSPGAWMDNEIEPSGFQPAPMDTLDSEMGFLEFAGEPGLTPAAAFTSSSDAVNWSTDFPKNISSFASPTPTIPISSQGSLRFRNGQRKSTFTKQTPRKSLRKKMKSVESRATSLSYSDRASNNFQRDNQVHQPQEVIRILEDFVQNFSITKKKAFRLVDKFKELIEVERDYWSPPCGSNTTKTMSSASSSLDGKSIFDPADSDLTSATSIYSADGTSIFELSVSSARDQAIYELPASNAAHTDRLPSGSICSTPRQLPYWNEAPDVNSSHNPCKLCGVEPLYCCTFKSCTYAIHDFSDWKRHEESAKHWPQQRYMCIECPTPALDSTGNVLCGFCLVPFSQLGVAPRNHYLLCTVAISKAKTFQRCDKLVAHLQADHGLADAGQSAAASKYNLSTRWPRECGFCGILFQSWEERMQHLGEHFREGLNISIWKLPFRGPKSYQHKKPDSQRKDDDSDDDDDFHGGSGPSYQRTFRRIGRCMKTSTQQQSQTSSSDQRNEYSGSSMFKCSSQSYEPSREAKFESKKRGQGTFHQSGLAPRDASVLERIQDQHATSSSQNRRNIDLPFILRYGSGKAFVAEGIRQIFEAAELDANGHHGSMGDVKPSTKRLPTLVEYCQPLEHSPMLERYLGDSNEAVPNFLNTPLKFEDFEQSALKIVQTGRSFGHPGPFLDLVPSIPPLGGVSRPLSQPSSRTTSRALILLEGIKFGGSSPKYFVDGGLECKNPREDVLKEATQDSGPESSYKGIPNHTIPFIPLTNPPSGSTGAFRDPWFEPTGSISNGDAFYRNQWLRIGTSCSRRLLCGRPLVRKDHLRDHLREYHQTGKFDNFVLSDHLRDYSNRDHNARESVKARMDVISKTMSGIESPKRLKVAAETASCEWLDDHAVIYSSRKPYYLDNKSKHITKRSIKCITDGLEDKLDPTSSLNYARLYTVEHNVKAWFVGQVAADYEQRVVVDCNLTHSSLADRPDASEASSADLTRNADVVRLVARGFQQIDGIDFEETFSAVVNTSSYRTFIALSAMLGYKIYQMDVKTAFLDGDIDAEIYVLLPPGFGCPKGKVLRLLKALYGLKQGPRLWY